MTYIHEIPAWPRFNWDHKTLAEKLAAVRNRQGRLTGRMEAFGFKLKTEANVETLTEEVIKSSEIEGEVLDGIRCARRSHAGSASISAP